MKVLSLFDGMSCGRIALDRLGIEVDTYYASEIDKYAIAVAKENYPDTIHVGDIKQLDPKDFQDIDLILAGSPCQGFSFAGKQLAFDDPRSALFFEFIRLLKAIKPKYFLLENVRMKQQYIDVITQQVSECYPDHEGNDLFDSKIEPILINSALLSAQSRQRLYWTNIPRITQPEDRGIVLKDVLEDDVEEHYLAGKNLLENYQGGNQLNPNYKSQANTIHDKNKKSGVICAGTHGYANGYVETKPIKVGMNIEEVKVRKHEVDVPGLQKCILSHYQKSTKDKRQIAQELNDKYSTVEHYFRKLGSEFFSIPSEDHWPQLKKILNIKTTKFDKQIMEFEYRDGVFETKQRVYSDQGKAPTLTASNKEQMIETKPKQVGKIKDGGQGNRIYSTDGKSSTLSAQSGGTAGNGNTLIETKPKQVGVASDINGHDILKRVYSPEGKSLTLNTMGGGNREPKVAVENRIVVDLERKRLILAEANEKGYTIIEDGDCFDINYPNSKTRRGRKMKYKCNALTPSAQEYMHFKDLTWRKLTPLECERLQTVPDNYTASVSNTQRYKMLGNGWTVEVICHILKNMEN
jgi:DNA-cytosine methyltransferase